MGSYFPGNGSFRPLVVSALSRFGRGSFRPGSFRPESIRPWVVSANFGESFRPVFFIQSVYTILYTLGKMCMLYEASLPCSQSCKGLGQLQGEKLHLYSIKNDRETTMVIYMASWFIKQKKHKRFNFIIFLTFFSS